MTYKFIVPIVSAFLEFPGNSRESDNFAPHSFYGDLLAVLPRIRLSGRFPHTTTHQLVALMIGLWGEQMGMSSHPSGRYPATASRSGDTASVLPGGVFFHTLLSPQKPTIYIFAV